MSRIFDEKFEGAGYEESWSEGVGDGCTINEDAATSDVSSPSGWDSQCLKVITTDSMGNYVYSQFGDAAIRYTRIEVIFTDLSALTLDNHNFSFVSGLNNAVTTFCFEFYCFRNSGVNSFIFSPYYDGNSHDTVVGTVSEDTRYRIEVKWDKTNNLYDCKINGSSVASGSLQTGSIQQGAVIIGSTASSNRAWTGYFDLIAFDDANWVGEEISIIAGTTCWGHPTESTETNKRTFTDNWTGTGSITGSGDSEKLKISSGQYMESEIVETGEEEIELTQNVYETGDDVTLSYKTGATVEDCNADSWHEYSVPFDSTGYVKVKASVA